MVLYGLILYNLRGKKSGFELENWKAKTKLFIVQTSRANKVIVLVVEVDNNVAVYIRPE